MNEYSRKFHIFYCLSVGIPGLICGIWYFFKCCHAVYNQYMGYDNYEGRAFFGMFLMDVIIFFFAFYALKKGIAEMKVTRKN